MTELDLARSPTVVGRGVLDSTLDRRYLLGHDRRLPFSEDTGLRGSHAGDVAELLGKPSRQLVSAESGTQNQYSRRDKVPRATAKPSRPRRDMIHVAVAEEFTFREVESTIRQ